MKTLLNNRCKLSQIFVAIILLCSGALTAQPYYQLATDLLKEDETRNLQLTPFDGGHVTAGFSIDDLGTKRMNLVKYDATGMVMWDMLYDFGTEACWANAVEFTSDGGYILAGAALSPITGVINGALVKTDPFGFPMWSETYDYSSPYAELFSVEELPPSPGPETYVTTGAARNAFNGTLDAITLVVSPTGAIVHNGILDTSFDEEGYSVKPEFSPVGGVISYVITGYTTKGPFAGDNILLAKFDPTLSTVAFSEIIGADGDERGRSVEILPTGEILAAGHSNSYSNGKEDIWIGLFDPAGAVIWNNVYGQKGNEQAYSVEITHDAKVVATGWTDYKTGGNKDAVIIKADLAAGGLIWASAFGGGQDEWGYSVKENFFTGDIQMGGYCEATSTSADDRNLFGVRTNSTGDSACARTLNYAQKPVLGRVPFDVELGIFGYSGSVPVSPFNPPPVQRDICCDCSDMIVDFIPTSVIACAGDVVTFKNTSICVNQYRWFVNGTAVGPGPDLTYTFAAPGTYLIELGGRNAGCPIIKKSITVTVACGPSPKMEDDRLNVAVNPNPASDMLTLSATIGETGGTAVVELSDISGRVLMQADVEIANGSVQHQFDVSSLPEGIYNVSITTVSNRQSITTLVSH